MNYQHFIEILEQHLFTCSVRSFFGFPCPGCGMQRAFLALLRGDPEASIQHHPALIPFLITLIYSFLHLRFNYRKGPRNVVVLFVFTGSLMIVNFIVKLSWPQ